MRRCAPAVVLVAAVALMLPGLAAAHGDPTGDALRRRDASYPRARPTTAALRRALDGLLADARRGGYPMKVALLAGAGDLGAYEALFVQPQVYAPRLADELTTLRHGVVIQRPLHLLVVTPAGFGGVGLGDRVDEALVAVGPPAAGGPDALAQAAMKAVSRIATLNGHRLPPPASASAPLPPQPPASGQSGGRTSGVDGGSPAAFALPACLVLLGALAAGRLAARRNASREE